MEFWKLNLRIGILEIKFERNWNYFRIKVLKIKFRKQNFGNYFENEILENLNIGVLEN